MAPVLTQWNGVGEAVILAHAVAAARVLHASDSPGERHVHNLFVKFSEGNGSRNEVVGAGRVRENECLVGVGMVRCHLDQAMALVLREVARGRRTTSGSCTAPKDVVRLFFPGHFHVIDVLGLV